MTNVCPPLSVTQWQRQDSGQSAHFHLHCISWKSDLSSWCPRDIWEFQLGDVIDWWTGWYEPQHGSASGLIICWHAAPSPSWPPPYLIPTETTIVSHNSLQEANSSCQPLPLLRRNLKFAETNTRAHLALRIFSMWWLDFIDWLEGRVSLFGRKPCCHRLLVHVQRSKIIGFLSCQETPLPPRGCYYLCQSQTWGNVFSLSIFQWSGTSTIRANTTSSTSWRMLLQLLSSS